MTHIAHIVVTEGAIASLRSRLLAGQASRAHRAHQAHQANQAHQVNQEGRGIGPH